MSSESSKAPSPAFDHAAVLDRLAQGALIFDSDGQLLFDNAAARQILGANLVVIRQQGWPAYTLLVDSGILAGSPKADEIRAKALRQTEPVRFHMMLSDAYVPCWISGVHQDGGPTLTLVTIERPDWTPISELMENFRKEALPTIDDADGHANFIIQIATRRKATMTADELAQRVIGFAELISGEMGRLQKLIRQLHQLEIIRTGQIEEIMKTSIKKISLADFVEDLIEELSDVFTHIPGHKDQDIRDRLKTDISDDLELMAAPQYLTHILTDILHNAVLYTKKDSPIQLRAFATNQGRHIQIDIIDQGCGIRDSEYDRVFAPFQRARQPQILAEFGYGLSMALAKANADAMSGRLWFSSEESVGTTFSLKLPANHKKTDEKESAKEESEDKAPKEKSSKKD